MRMSTICWAAALAVIVACNQAIPAKPQSIQQSGTVTPGHAVCWTTNGVVQDCGTSATPFLTTLGVVGQGTNLCAWSGPPSGAANRICFNTTPTALSLNFDNLNGATGSAQVCVNGACSGLNTQNHVTVGVRSTNASSVAASPTTDYFLCLDSTSNTIAVSLPATPTIGLSYLIKDCTGQAGTHSITITPAAGNIDGNSNYVMSVPFQSVGLTYTGAQWSLN